MVGAMSPLSGPNAGEEGMSKHEEMQKIIRYYKRETGLKEVDMHRVAEFAVTKGWKLPKPENPMDRLAREFAAAARVEVRKDKVTGRPYRANHVFSVQQGDLFLHLWVDIDEAPRPQMLAAFSLRRDQMVGDAWQLTLDVGHWNRVNPHENRIQMEMNFEPDMEWRMNAPDEKAS